MKKLTLLLFLTWSTYSFSQELDFSPNYMVGNWKESHTEITDGKSVTYYVRCNYKENANMIRFSRYNQVTVIPYRSNNKPQRRCLFALSGEIYTSFIKYDADKNQLVYYQSNSAEEIRYQLKRIERDTFIMYRTEL